MKASGSKRLSAKSLSIIVIVVLGLCWFYQMRVDGNKRMSIVHGMRMTSGFKTVLAEYYQAENEFPNSNSEVQLPEPEEFSDSIVKSIGLERGGVIKITYNESSGIDNGSVYIVPDANGSRNIEWLCVSTTIRNISSLVEECKFDQMYRVPASK